VLALGRELDRASNRAAGVVDEDVDATVLLQHLFGEAPHVGGVGEVGGTGVCDAAVLGDPGCDVLELVGTAGDEQHPAPCTPDPQGGRLADSRGGAGDEDRAIGERPLQALASQPPQRLGQRQRQVSLRDSGGQVHQPTEEPAGVK
jgi:hypothetical protein